MNASFFTESQYVFSSSFILSRISSLHGYAISVIITKNTDRTKDPGKSHAIDIGNASKYIKHRIKIPNACNPKPMS